METYKIRSGDMKEYIFSENEKTLSVLQNLRLLYGTKKGSIPMYRDFGLEMAFVDKPAHVARVMAIADIKEATRKFEPRADFVGLEMEDNGLGTLSTVVEVKIL